MQQLFALILVFSLWFGFGLTAPAAHADFSFDALTPCSSSEAFKENIATEVSAFEARLANFEAGSAPAQYLEGKIAAVKERGTKYASSTLLCGKEDGLPHLISDGRWDHAGEFLIPSLIFLYITGWIGWVGRDYVRAIKADPSTATQKEIIIDVPLALRFMLTGFTWPLAAVKEFGDGSLVASEKEVTVSPR